MDFFKYHEMNQRDRITDYSRVSNKHPGHLSLMGFFLPLKGQLQILDY